MKLINKYYTIEQEDNFYWFIPGSEDLPKGVFSFNKEELDLYIHTLETAREYLYE